MKGSGARGGMWLVDPGEELIDSNIFSSLVSPRVEENHRKERK